MEKRYPKTFIRREKAHAFSKKKRKRPVASLEINKKVKFYRSR
jgi:hypothetical protein